MRKLAERIRLLAIKTRVSRIGKRLDYTNHAVCVTCATQYGMIEQVPDESFKCDICELLVFMPVSA